MKKLPAILLFAFIFSILVPTVEAGPARHHWWHHRHHHHHHHRHHRVVIIK